MELKLILSYDRQPEVLQLFTEYINLILEQGDDVKRCLEAQHYSDEGQELEEKYGLPHGRLYLACYGEDIAGCVALKRTDDSYCEIKRLYVRPQYRGKHIGKALVQQVIADAKRIGYQHMRLDTFPFMDNAIELYKRNGFYVIERYNDNPAPTAIYMQLDLQP